MAITTTTVHGETDIRVAPELSFTIPCTVTNTGITADSEGRKIIYAGTPIGAGATRSSSNDVLRVNTATSPLVVDTSYPQGICLHDVDVTAGAKEATIMIAGYVDLYKVASAVETLIGTAYGAYNAADADLKFVKRR